VVFFTEPQEKDDLNALIKELVTENSPLKGKAFFQILTEAGGEFKNIDRRQYTCAQATIYDTLNGKIFTAGKMHLDMIKKLSS
jgi:methenyltetrahydromethanopterin cyclohydrolase